MFGADDAITYVFGHSDSDSDLDIPNIPEVGVKQCWKNVENIKGLWICKSFMTIVQQDELLSKIDAEGWFAEESHNQAMRFNDLPKWALELSNLIYHAICSYIFANDSLPLDSSHYDEDNSPLKISILTRVPLFDQMIVNRYKCGEGICPHVDLLQFEDGIAILSLESACVMHFSQLLGTSSKYHYGYQSRDMEDILTGTGEKIPILLEPGDLILLSGDARYNWAHEINRSEKLQMWNGQKITQRRRTSVTLRKMIASTEVMS